MKATNNYWYPWMYEAATDLNDSLRLYTNDSLQPTHTLYTHTHTLVAIATHTVHTHTVVAIAMTLLR